MEHNEEPHLSLLISFVNPPDGEEGQWEPERGDEMYDALPHHAFSKLRGTEDGMTGYQHQVDKNKEQKI